MDEFFTSNPGMSSRVAHHLDFAAYELDELTAIGWLMLDQSRYYLSEDAEEAFRQYLTSQMDQPLFANARSVRNELERARLRHAHRLASDLHRNWTRDDLMRLEPADILDATPTCCWNATNHEGTRAAGQVLGCARGPTGRRDGRRPGRRIAPDRRIRGVQGRRFIGVTREQDRLWVGSMPEAYERWLAPSVFRPFAQDLARRAARLAPRKVLELAAGTGVLTTELLTALPAADVTATDLNAAMVGFGSRQAPGADWQQADALDLPFGDGRFDLVACQFGVMFFPDKPAAFAQVRRVLAPGGTLLFTTWGDVGMHGFATALVAGIERAYPEDPPVFMATVPHGYFDLDQVVADLSAGGMGDVSVEAVTLDGYAASAADVAAGFCAGTPLRMELAARGDLAEGTKVVAEEMTARLGAGRVTASMTAYVVEARPSPRLPG